MGKSMFYVLEHMFQRNIDLLRTALRYSMMMVILMYFGGISRDSTVIYWDHDSGMMTD